MQVASEVSLAVAHQVTKYDESSDPCDLDFLIYKLQQLYRVLITSDVADSVLESLGQCLNILASMQEDSHFTGYRSETVTNSGRGRPRFEISRYQLEYLLKLGMNCPTIAACLGVSVRTVRRRMSEFGLSVSALYAPLSNADLDSVVSDIKCVFPNCGYRMLSGHLRSRGIRVTQERVRESLHRVDPCGSVARWATAIQRRRYSVAGPLSLWHIDGNHKLIR